MKITQIIRKYQKMKIFLLLCLLEQLPLISAIFGGEYVSTAYEFPWMARLFMTKKISTEYGLTLASGIVLRFQKN